MSSDSGQINNTGPGRTTSRLALALVFTVFGCDNVEWGGARVSFGQPEVPGQAEQAERAETPVDSAPPERRGVELPTGPILFHVLRLDEAGHARIVPVAEYHDRRLDALPTVNASAEFARGFAGRFYRQGQDYALYRRGVRVGTVVVDSASVGGNATCAELAAYGQLELRPRADTLSEFLAAPPGRWSAADSLVAPEYRADMRSLAPVLAERELRRLQPERAWRPPVPADLRALHVGDGPLGFAASFLLDDSLAVGPPPDTAETAFLVADYEPNRGYFPVYFEARRYGTGAKRALRWLDAVDLVGDTAHEWVLRAYGDAAAWHEVVGSTDTARTVIWSNHDPVCDAQPPEDPSDPTLGSDLP